MQSDQGNFKFWTWTWRETWDHARKHVLQQGAIMITTFISATVVAIIGGKGWSGLLYGLAAGLGGLFLYILVIFFWKRIIAARQIRLEEEQLSAHDVLEYALRYSGLKEQNKIETELRKAALRKKNPITIEVQRSGDSIWTSIPQDILRTHAIDLVSDRLYNFSNPKAELYGESLYFYGHEIRKLWKEKKEDNSQD